MNIFTSNDGQDIMYRGQIGWRKTYPLYAIRQTSTFTVLTDKGPLRGEAGDYLVYDEEDGVRPMAASQILSDYSFHEGNETA